VELLFLLTFGSVLLAGGGLASVLSRQPTQRRLARLADGSRAPVSLASGEGVLAHEGPSRWMRLLAPLAGAGAHQAPRTHPIRLRLIQAGYRLPSSLVLYLGGRVALAIVLPTTLLLSSPVWSLSELQLLGLLLAAASVGFVGPGLWLDRARAVRQREVIHGLPDALDLLVVCVEAGLGIPILSSELELVTLEIRAGKSTTEALRALAERTGVAEVSSLVAMLVQTERFGTSLTDTLRVQADAMRVQRLHRAEEQAGKAPLKMIFPTLLIFLATLIVTIGPGMLQFFSFFEGSGG
jgi:tight adherence protein C